MVLPRILKKMVIAFKKRMVIFDIFFYPNVLLDKAG